MFPRGPYCEHAEVNQHLVLSSSQRPYCFAPGGKRCPYPVLTDNKCTLQVTIDNADYDPFCMTKKKDSIRGKGEPIPPFWQPLAYLVLVLTDQFQCLEQISGSISTKCDNKALCCTRTRLSETVEVSSRAALREVTSTKDAQAPFRLQQGDQRLLMVPKMSLKAINADQTVSTRWRSPA